MARPLRPSWMWWGTARRGPTLRVVAKAALRSAPAPGRWTDVLAPPRPMPTPMTIWACVSAMASTSSVWCTSRTVTSDSAADWGRQRLDRRAGAAVWRDGGEHPRAECNQVGQGLGQNRATLPPRAALSCTSCPCALISRSMASPVSPNCSRAAMRGLPPPVPGVLTICSKRHGVPCVYKN